MKTIKITASIIFDDDMMYGGYPEDKVWFFNEILLGEELILHSNEIGDEIGILKIRSIDENI